MDDVKKCSKCKEEIKTDANKCKHCNADLRNWFVRHKILSAIFGFILLSIIISAVSDEDSNTNNDTSENYFPNAGYQDSNVAKQSNDQLELLSLNCYTESTYFHITGEVKNISSKSLESIVAVGTAYTEDMEFVKSSDTLIEYNPILAGQKSPFEVLFTGNPAISKCKVDFKEFFGGKIPTKDVR